MQAIIGGTSFLESNLFSHLKEEVIVTEYGQVSVLRGEQFVFLQRHGLSHNTPPHKINHKANISALHQLGISKVIAINSTGSLKKTIKPGSILIPDDYFNLFNIPTFFDDCLKFTIPGLDPYLRSNIVELAAKNRIDLITRGIYFQVKGPVLETPAEIEFIKQIGDVVGMTMANEAILAKELGLQYASICSVDNFANGISEIPLTLDRISEMQKTSLTKIEKLLNLILNT